MRATGLSEETLEGQGSSQHLLWVTCPSAIPASQSCALFEPLRFQHVILLTPWSKRANCPS